MSRRDDLTDPNTVLEKMPLLDSLDRYSAARVTFNNDDIFQYKLELSAYLSIPDQAPGSVKQ